MVASGLPVMSYTTREAIGDAGLGEQDISSIRTGLIVGSGGASTENVLLCTDTARQKGPRKVGPYMVARCMSSAIAANLATAYKIKGVSYTISSACATSAHCIGNVKELEAIREVFGDASPPISSTKSLTGQALGAASVNEAIYSLLMMDNGFSCASANIGNLDPAAAGTWLIACSASRGDGQRRVDARVGRHRRAVADQEVLVAEHAVAARRPRLARHRAPMTAPPRMCAVVGMFAQASSTMLCAMPPVCFGQPLGGLRWPTSMKVGFGFSGSCSVVSDTPPNRPRFARKAIALSRLCMTRKISVRRDQPKGHSVLRKVSGWRDHVAQPASAAG